MILTDKKIRELAKKENMISPFDEASLQSESYDLSIGNEISEFKKPVRCIDLEKEQDDLYENIDITGEEYIIAPKQYILVSLKEKIHLPNNITAHIRPRTRFTRIGLVVSDQHCNSTYEGILRLGVFNATDYAIKIKPNASIAQIVFEELEEVPSEEKLYKNKKNAAYQKEKEFRGYKVPKKIMVNIDDLVNEILG